jgi:cytochrome c oxidase subunit 2
MKRDLLIVGVLAAIGIAIGEAFVLTVAPFPHAASEEAEHIDGAYVTLGVLAVPVVALVFATLGYSVLRWRSRGAPTEDGAHVVTHGPVVATWFLATAALTAVVIIHPGVTGMLKLHPTDRHTDLVVKVDGMRWMWRVTYPDQQVTATSEMVLPVNKRVRFDVTSSDVLHAFWVPAFRMKVDAVPGRVTTVYATPNKLGNFEDAYSFKLQCAELCGLGHGVMHIPVRVVDDQAFAAWVAQQQPAK